ncbi:hypothetical protein CVT25_009348 [Psilocybe cyanescens]|uniref:F-box domain-containing protein n=1 Tax=Psilocybe cyanescens TaxID=93625 RepID=A0A409X8D6_PSICY|nr:hypothetical protein CVT25_009348 [Psilocybe cyanescens]
MSLSPDAEPTQVLPALPVELIDDIIDEASRTLDVSSVSSIALTSHSFRIRANKTRFSSLVPYRKEGYDIKHTSKRLQSLADIISSGRSIYAMPGVCEFATSFSLHMIGYYDLVMPALNNGNLVYIFNHLFRTSDATYTQSTTRSLSRFVYIVGTVPVKTNTLMTETVMKICAMRN